MSFTEGTVVRGRYRIEGTLGRGGMGVVYAARHLELDRSVAIKTLTADDREYLERFRREAKVLSSLSHPNVVQVLDFFAGDDETPPYLVMERLHGRPLNEVLRDGGPMSEERVVEIGLQLTDAISAAHAAGVVHRDVKPGNVLLIETTLGRDAIKLLDFGVARDLHSKDNLTAEGAVVGTLAWLSPEQVNGHPADAQSDIYAIGATLYFCLLARRPFAQGAVGELISSITSGRHDRLASLRPGSAVAKVIDRAMDVDRSRRYLTAKELGDALKACSSSPSELAPPSAAPTRELSVPGTPPAPRAAPRGRTLALVVAALGVVALGIGIGMKVSSTPASETLAASAPPPPPASTTSAPSGPPSITPSITPSTTPSVAEARASVPPPHAVVPSGTKVRQLSAQILEAPLCADADANDDWVPPLDDVSSCGALLSDPEYVRTLDVSLDRSGRPIAIRLVAADARVKATPEAFPQCVLRALVKTLRCCRGSTDDRTLRIETDYY